LIVNDLNSPSKDNGVSIDKKRQSQNWNIKIRGGMAFAFLVKTLKNSAKNRKLYEPKQVKWRAPCNEVA